jgi:hypothetical protein
MSRTASQENRQPRRAWAKARLKAMKLGSLSILEIQHDEQCGIFTAEQCCSCNPTRVLKDRDGRILASLKKAGSYDPFMDFSEQHHD